jgi:RNA polymerase sigma factor (sigma-70 family)
VAEAPNDRGWWRGVLGRVVRATRGSPQAEDYLHSAFLRLEDYRQAHSVENPAGFLVRAAVNIAADEARRPAARTTEPRPVEDLIDIADSEPLADEVLAARKRLERVKAGLAQLSPRTREIFLMHRVEGLKYREIAAELGITVSAVEKHVAKAALFLAEWVEGW